MRIEFDATVCTGHGRCYAIAPEVFDADDDGHCVVLHPSVPAHLETAARRGAANCPEGALRTVDDTAPV